MKEPQTLRLKVKSHEMHIMARLCDLSAALKPDRRAKVHEHIGDLIRLDDLDTIAQAQPAPEATEAPPLPFHRAREGAGNGEQAA